MTILSEFSITLDFSRDELPHFLQYMAQQGVPCLAFQTSICPSDTEEHNWYRICKFVADTGKEELVYTILDEAGYQYNRQQPRRRPAFFARLEVPGYVTGFLTQMGLNGVVIRSMSSVRPQDEVWRVGFGFVDQDKQTKATEILAAGMEEIQDILVELDPKIEKRDLRPTSTIGYTMYVPSKDLLANVTGALKNYRAESTAQLHRGVYVYNIAVTDCRHFRRMRLLTYVHDTSPSTALELTTSALDTIENYQYSLHNIVRVVLPRSFEYLYRFTDLLQSQGVLVETIHNLPRQHEEREGTMTLFSVDHEQRELVESLLPP